MEAGFCSSENTVFSNYTFMKLNSEIMKLKWGYFHLSIKQLFLIKEDNFVR